MYDIVKDDESNLINISLTRGDYFAVYVGMTKEDQEFVPAGGSMRFALKKKYKDNFPVLINKDIPLNTMLLELEKDDTKPLAFGEYVYDIEYTDELGRPCTFIKGIFTLTGEVI